MNDGQPLIEKYQSDVAAALRRMADHVDRNKEANSFGGLAVIIPPENGGEPIELLILDSQADIAQFYSTLQSRITIRVLNLDETRKRQQAFGGR